MLSIGFFIFELGVGLYFPSVGSVRAKIIPEQNRSSLTSLFRVLPNCICVVMLLNVQRDDALTVLDSTFSTRNSVLFNLSAAVYSCFFGKTTL